jgi:hypothetical protein
MLLMVDENFLKRHNAKLFPASFPQTTNLRPNHLYRCSVPQRFRDVVVVNRHDLHMPWQNRPARGIDAGGGPRAVSPCHATQDARATPVTTSRRRIYTRVTRGAR